MPNYKLYKDFYRERIRSVVEYSDTSANEDNSFRNHIP